MIWLEFARRQKRWSQQNLADASGVHQHFISMTERGRGLPTSDERERLARALDIPADKLLEPVPDLVSEFVATEGGRG